MKFSVIIPTYNRIDELQELIPSLENQNFPNDQFELVIVDDGSTDNTESYIRSLTTKFDLKYLKQKNLGPGAARNNGMSNSRGEYFIFVDSDCLLPPDYLSNISQFLLKHDTDAFGGSDTFHPSFSPLLKAINYSMTSFLGTGGTRGSKKSVARFYPRSFNMGLSRRVYEAIGGFGDLRHGQDMDYSARIYEAGFSVSLIPDNAVYHKRRTSIKKFFKQIYNWGVARINLSTLHSGFLKPIHLAPAFVVAASFLLFMLISIKILPLFFLKFWLVIAAIVAVIAFYQSYNMYKELKIALLSIMTLFIQVAAYGLGSISGLFQRFILRKKEARGFVKNYYK